MVQQQSYVAADAAARTARLALAPGSRAGISPGRASALRFAASASWADAAASASSPPRPNPSETPEKDDVYNLLFRSRRRLGRRERAATVPRLPSRVSRVRVIALKRTTKKTPRDRRAHRRRARGRPIARVHERARGNRRRAEPGPGETRTTRFLRFFALPKSDAFYARFRIRLRRRSRHAPTPRGREIVLVLVLVSSSSFSASSPEDSRGASRTFVSPILRDLNIARPRDASRASYAPARRALSPRLAPPPRRVARRTPRARPRAPARARARHHDARDARPPFERQRGQPDGRGRVSARRRGTFVRSRRRAAPRMFAGSRRVDPRARVRERALHACPSGPTPASASTTRASVSASAPAVRRRTASTRLGVREMAPSRRRTSSEVTSVTTRGLDRPRAVAVDARYLRDARARRVDPERGERHAARPRRWHRCRPRRRETQRSSERVAGSARGLSPCRACGASWPSRTHPGSACARRGARDGGESPPQPAPRSEAGGREDRRYGDSFLPTHRRA